MRPLIACALILFAGCDGIARDVEPEDVDARPPAVERALVAMGVARLSSRHAAALLAAVDDDTRCGFKSDAAKASLTVNGQPGDDGDATWTVKDCELVFEPEEKLDTDCEGGELWIGGRAVISATRTVKGVVTTDPEQPLAPDAPDAAKISLDVRFERFTVRESTSDTRMTAFSGSLRFAATPRLAVSQSLGLCTVPTPQLKLDDVTIENGDFELSRDGRELRVKVPAARFSAQVGQGVEHENWLEGQVTVWETPVQVPARIDSDGLVPGYQRDAFIRSFQCRKDLATPVSHVCPPPREKPAQGVAALSVKLLGAIAKQIEKDTTCGFAAPAVKSAFVSNGAVGTKGQGAWTLPAPCTLRFAAATVADRDCLGTETFLEGEVEVSGSRTVRGWLTGDPAEPVVPATSTPATLALTLKPRNLKLSDNKTQHVLVLNGGTMTGTLEPKTALDKTTRACSIATPVAKVTVKHEGVSAEVKSGGIGVPLVVSNSTLEASSGPANTLTGTVTAAGQQLSASAALDPAFDPVKFEDSYRCEPNLELPANEAACSFARPLAEGTARMMVRNAAGLARLINDNGNCGFQNRDILTDPFLVVGRPGQLGRMGWNAYCGVGTGSRQQFSKDCNNVVTTVEGSAAVPAQRIVDGFRDEICGGFLNLFCADTIIPIKSDAVSFSLVNVRLNNFGLGNDDGRLIIRTGTLSSAVKPFQGRRRGNGHFDVGTPIVGVSDLKLQGATVTLTTGKKTFTFPVTDTNLKGFNGAFAGQKNSLSGTLTVDGVPIDLGTMELTPNYDQMAFDKTYSCTSELTAVLVP